MGGALTGDGGGGTEGEKEEDRHPLNVTSRPTFHRWLRLTYFTELIKQNTTRLFFSRT